MNTEITGKRIKERRNLLGLTLSALAEKLDGYHSEGGKSKISKWENGTVPPLKVIIKLASILDCDPEYLLGCIEHPHVTTSWIAEQMPLSENSIELLKGLKQECDDRSDLGVMDDSHLTAFLTDFVTASIIATHDIGGINEVFLSLIHDYTEALEIMDEYVDTRVIDRSERYMKSKWALEEAEKRIGQLFGEIICDQLQLYLHSGIKLTDSIKLGCLRKEVEKDGNL